MESQIIEKRRIILNSPRFQKSEEIPAYFNLSFLSKVNILYVISRSDCTSTKFLSAVLLLIALLIVHMYTLGDRSCASMAKSFILIEKPCNTESKIKLTLCICLATKKHYLTLKFIDDGSIYITTDVCSGKATYIRGYWNTSINKLHATKFITERVSNNVMD